MCPCTKVDGCKPLKRRSGCLPGRPALWQASKAQGFRHGHQKIPCLEMRSADRISRPRPGTAGETYAHA